MVGGMGGERERERAINVFFGVAPKKQKETLW